MAMRSLNIHTILTIFHHIYPRISGVLSFVLNAHNQLLGLQNEAQCDPVLSQIIYFLIKGSWLIELSQEKIEKEQGRRCADYVQQYKDLETPVQKKIDSVCEIMGMCSKLTTKYCDDLGRPVEAIRQKYCSDRGTLQTLDKIEHTVKHIVNIHNEFKQDIVKYLKLQHLLMQKDLVHMLKISSELCCNKLKFLVYYFDQVKRFIQHKYEERMTETVALIFVFSIYIISTTMKNVPLQSSFQKYLPHLTKASPLKSMGSDDTISFQGYEPSDPHFVPNTTGSCAQFISEMQDQKELQCREREIGIDSDKFSSAKKYEPLSDIERTIEQDNSAYETEEVHQSYSTDIEQSGIIDDFSDESSTNMYTSNGDQQNAKSFAKPSMGSGSDAESSINTYTSNGDQENAESFAKPSMGSGSYAESSMNMYTSNGDQQKAESFAKPSMGSGSDAESSINTYTSNGDQENAESFAKPSMGSGSYAESSMNMYTSNGDQQKAESFAKPSMSGGSDAESSINTYTSIGDQENAESFARPSMDSVSYAESSMKMYTSNGDQQKAESSDEMSVCNECVDEYSKILSRNQSDAACISENNSVQTSAEHFSEEFPKLKLHLLESGANDLALLFNDPDKDVVSNLCDGLALFNKSFLQEAIEYFRRSQQMNESRHDYRVSPVSIAVDSSVHYYMGEVEYKLGRYGTAVDHYRESLNSHTESEFNGIPYISKCSKQEKLALALRANNDISNSIAVYKAAIHTAPENALSCCTGLGNLYHSTGNHQAALLEYKIALSLAEKKEDHLSLSWIHGNLGNTYFSVGMQEKGIHHLKLALDLTYEHDPSPSSISRALNNLGTGYQSFGNYDVARELYDDALYQAIFGEDRVGQARARGNIGNLYMAQKDYERAVLQYSEVLELSCDASIVYVAHHNRGCGYYELAEKERKQQHASVSPNVESTDSTKEEDIRSLYQRGLEDLDKVIANHENAFSGSMHVPQSSDLFVSLFEANIKTYNRAQDCAYCLGDYHRALLLAEQCRSRTLAELLLNCKSSYLHTPLQSPLTLGQLSSVLTLQEPNVPVVVLSWTGNRLLVWILTYDGNDITMDTFEQQPSKELFDGLSLDSYLQYSLGHLLSHELELYGETAVEVTEQSTLDDEEHHSMNLPEMEEKSDDKVLHASPISNLYNLVAKPLKKTLATAEKSSPKCSKKKKLVLIPDGTTKFIPFSSLRESDDSSSCFGDEYIVRFMPSLLTLGIMSQIPSVKITVPPNENDICLLVVGDPSTPPFKVNGREWNLGPLPHAREEAEWVGHYMKCKPLLHHEPTKEVVISRLKTAKLVHIATHGSASQGFLVLAGTTYDTQTTLPINMSKAMNIDEKQLLLYISDLESLSLHAGLVVLSSCDSGRGAIKGDDIQGMTRAFLLAGAQSVVTSLWKIPDKSARFFMQFFYRFLLDGNTSSEALSKASCSIRAFEEFSSMIHWSGYQITGKDIRVEQLPTKEEEMLKKVFGKGCTPFPHLDVLTKLRVFLLEEKSSDIQVR